MSRHTRIRAEGVVVILGPKGIGEGRSNVIRTLES